MQQEQRPKTKSQLFAQYDLKQVKKAQERISEKITLRLRKKNLSDSNKIMTTLKNHFIFYNLSENQLQNIKEKMFYCEVKQNQPVYQEGYKGDCFFIVERGSLEVTENDKFKKQLKPDDGFGEIALLYLTQRSSTVTPKQDCSLWVIDRVAFRQAVQQVIIKQYNQNRKCLEGVRFFSQLTYQQKDIISSTLITQKYYKNQSVVQQGDPGSSLYYVKDGVLSVYKGDKLIRKLGRGDSFGQQSLYYNTMRQYTIKADDEVTCLVLGRDTLNRILRDQIYDVTFKNFIRWSFDKNQILSKLSKKNIDKIIQQMKISSFKAHESVFRKGVSGFQKLIVVIEGSLKKLKNGTIVAAKGQCYGEDFLLAQNKNKILDDEIVMNTYGVIAQVNNNAFFQALGQFQIEKVIEKDSKKKKGPVLPLSNFKENCKKFELSKFIYVDKIADGQFGQVFLARDPELNLYAIKSYEKKVLQQYDVEKFIQQQKKVLDAISYPLAITTGKVFQTEQLLFFINQYIYGLNFYDVLKEIGLLSTEDCQFYVANIILLLEHFQEKFVICRDIKPQNFMVTDKGYLKLINLSTAKISNLNNNQFLKTYTIIGTPHYMAPDIILGKGYNNLVDLWSVGICLYEFLCGVLPFGDSAQGAYEIYEEIMQSEVRFPEFITDKKAKKLVEQLLSHNPQQRHAGSFLNLKSNPFFQDLDWNQFFNAGKLYIPYYPEKSANIINAKATSATEPLLKYLLKINNDKYKVGPNAYRWDEFGPVIKQ